MAADVERPRLLETQGLAQTDSRITYARGKLILWTSQSGLDDIKNTLLIGQDFRHLAVANPKLSPYGMAAQQVMIKLDVAKAAIQASARREYRANLSICAQRQCWAGGLWLTPSS